MPTLRDTVKEVLSKLKLRQPENEAVIFNLFKKNLTRQERKHARCVSLRQDTLYVNVDSSVWLYQLNQKKENLLTKLGIKDIRLRIGKVEEDEKEKGN